jgi:hypothetical protein
VFLAFGPDNTAQHPRNSDVKIPRSNRSRHQFIPSSPVVDFAGFRKVHDRERPLHGGVDCSAGVFCDGGYGPQPKGSDVMHKFNIGQSVDLITTVLRPSAAGAYEIRHLVPAPDGSPDNPRYRIKSIAEKHERVASESELTLSHASDSVFS